MDLIRLENEIKLLLRFRLSEYDYDLAVVEAYMAMDRSVMCRIELFKEQWIVEMRVAKYEAPVQEGFYFDAEQYLIGILSEKPVSKSRPEIRKNYNRNGKLATVE